MVILYREYVEILCVGLLKYYQVYKGLPESDNIQKDSRIVSQLANDIINELNEQYPYCRNTIKGITLFELYEIYFDREINDINGVQFGYEYIELLVKFISTKQHTVRSNEIIMTILPVEIDGVDITHGMIVNYFDRYYK